MKLRPKQGHIIHQPLDALFTMRELGGSASQKYDATNDEFIADRTLTPFVLAPLYTISDGQEELPAGDYTDKLVNCVWKVEGKHDGNKLQLGTDYLIDDATHALTVQFNLDPDTHGKVEFSADYVDPRRGDVLKVHWEKTLSCVSATDMKLKLQSEWPGRVNLVPWKDRGTFQIVVQLYNGTTQLDADKAVYQWQVYEDNGWRAVSTLQDFWCRGGEQTAALTVEQKYIQKVTIRCLAWMVTETDRIPEKAQILAFMLRRYYGFYDDDLDILEGAYIFPETARAVAEAFVLNRHGGRIPHPTRYFDMEILYNRGDSTGWWHVCHGERGEVPRSMFPVDQTATHFFAPVIRELSALLPFTIGGEVLTIGGEVATGQHPVIEREFD